MQIICFTISISVREEVDHGRASGWLDATDEWCYRSSDELKSLKVGLVAGVNPEELPPFLGGEELRIVLSEPHFTKRRWLWHDDQILALSISNIPEAKPLRWAAIGLYIEQWRFRAILGCSGTCFFAPDAEIGMPICLACEASLCNLGYSRSIVRILALQATVIKGPEKAVRLLQLNLAEALRPLGISPRHPISNTAAAEISIDHHLRNETPVGSWLKEKVGEIQASKAELKTGYASNRSQFPRLPFLIACRRWNSWTPALPRSDSIHQNTGGGYFLSDGLSSLAIDPGYGFLDMLYKVHGITVMDIDAILITHDHPDHSAELQNIMGLRFVYKDQCEPMKVYLNLSSYYLYKRLLKYYAVLLEPGSPHPLAPGETLQVNGMTIKTIGMFHKEIFHEMLKNLDECQRHEMIKKVGDSKSLGLSILGNHPSGKPFHILVPGDTSFPIEYSEIEKIAAFYNEQAGMNIGRPDIACIHLGSLEEDWSCPGIPEPSKIRYKNDQHLGLNGIIKFLSLTRPKIAVVTEFGEELDRRDLRHALVEIAKEVLVDANITLLPSDSNLYLIMNEEVVFVRCVCKDLIQLKRPLHLSMLTMSFITALVQDASRNFLISP